MFLRAPLPDTGRAKPILVHSRLAAEKPLALIVSAGERFVLIPISQEHAVAVGPLVDHEVTVVEDPEFLGRVEAEGRHPSVDVRLIQPHPTGGGILPISVDHHDPAIRLHVFRCRVQMGLPALDHVQHAMVKRDVHVLDRELRVGEFAQHGADVRNARFLRLLGHVQVQATFLT